MAIARKPQSHQSEVESFIARGKIGPSPEDDRTCRDYPLSARAFKRVDAAAKARGVSPAARILMVPSRALDSGEW
jgi:hypothetical protein